MWISHLRSGLVVNIVVVLGRWLDLLLEVFSILNNSMVLWFCAVSTEHSSVMSSISATIIPKSFSSGLSIPLSPVNQWLPWPRYRGLYLDLNLMGLMGCLLNLVQVCLDVIYSLNYVKKIKHMLFVSSRNKIKDMKKRGTDLINLRNLSTAKLKLSLCFFFYHSTMIFVNFCGKVLIRDNLN